MGLCYARGMDTNTQGQAPELESPQVGNQEPASVDGAQDAPKTFDEAYVKQLRAEAAKYRTEAKALADKVSAYDAERMTEAEKLQAQAKAAQEAAEAARADLRQAKVETEIARSAAKLGIDVDLARRLADIAWEGDNPTGVESSINAALAKWPHLKPQPVMAGATNPARARALTMDDIRKFSPEEYVARRDEINAAVTQLAGG